MNTIYITPQDNSRLRLLLLLMPYSSERRGDALYLRRELDRALVCEHEERPTVIQIGTTFEFHDLRNGDTGAHTLCLPDDAQQIPKGLSVLSRFGAAVIGCSLGDEVSWATAVGMRRILIRSILQPKLGGPPSHGLLN